MAEKFSKDMKKWKDEEDEKLVKMYKEDEEKLYPICVELKRTPNSIVARLQKHGLLPNILNGYDTVRGYNECTELQKEAKEFRKQKRESKAKPKGDTNKILENQEKILRKLESIEKILGKFEVEI